MAEAVQSDVARAGPATVGIEATTSSPTLMAFLQGCKPSTLCYASLPGSDRTFSKLDEQAFSSDFGARCPGGASSTERTNVGFVARCVRLSGRVDSGEADERYSFAQPLNGDDSLEHRGEVGR
jgi:hypothetical protein